MVAWTIPNNYGFDMCVCVFSCVFELCWTHKLIFFFFVCGQYDDHDSLIDWNEEWRAREPFNKQPRKNHCEWFLTTVFQSFTFYNLRIRYTQSLKSPLIIPMMHTHTRTKRAKSELERMRARKTEIGRARWACKISQLCLSNTHTNTIRFKQRTAGFISVFLFLIWSLILTQLLIAANNISNLPSRHFFLLFLISSM